MNTPKAMDIKTNNMVFGNPARILSPVNNRKQKKKNLIHPEKTQSTFK